MEQPVAVRWVAIALLVLSGVAYVVALVQLGVLVMVYGLPPLSVVTYALLRRAHDLSGAAWVKQAARWIIPTALALSIITFFALAVQWYAVSVALATIGIVVPCLLVFHAAALLAAPGPPRTPSPTRRGIALLAWIVVAAAVSVRAGDQLELYAFSKSTADHAFTARHAGCYALNVGEWKPSSQPGHGFMGIAPSRVRLDTVFGRDVVYADTARIFRWRRERDMPLIRPGWYGSAYWAPIDVSRMALRWTTGFHGVWMVLHRGDDRYRGRARAFTDVLIPGRRSPEASVVAEPIDCALVAYDSARLMPPRDTR